MKFMFITAMVCLLAVSLQAQVTWENASRTIEAFDGEVALDEIGNVGWMAIAQWRPDAGQWADGTANQTPVLPAVVAQGGTNMVLNLEHNNYSTDGNQWIATVGPHFLNATFSWDGGAVDFADVLNGGDYRLSANGVINGAVPRLYYNIDVTPVAAGIEHTVMAWVRVQGQNFWTRLNNNNFGTGDNFSQGTYLVTIKFTPTTMDPIEVRFAAQPRNISTDYEFGVGAAALTIPDPYLPIDYEPANNVFWVPIESQLSWAQAEEAAGMGMYYQVYFGTEPDAELSNYGLDLIHTTSPSDESPFSCEPPELLDYSTDYYWFVIAYVPNEPDDPIAREGPLLKFRTVGAQAHSAIPVILDTDLATDCDDAGALAMLHGWATTGHVNFLAVGVSTKNQYNVLCVDAINTWYGRGTLPIGVTKNAGAYTPNETNVKYARQISEEYPRTYPWTQSDDAPDVISVYRQALAAQPDIDADNPGVVIISIGMLTNISDLLQSGPCTHSQLNGTQLVQAKVRLWSCMGGRFSDHNTEYNIRQNISASQYAIDNWPTPLVLSPFEVGDPIRTGSGLQPLTGHILRRIYHLSGYLTNGRQSWDQCASLYAVLGIDDGPAAHYWTLSGPGNITVDSNGRTTWASDPQGLQQYKTVPSNISTSLIAAEIEGLMVAARSVAPGFIISLDVAPAAAGIEATIRFNLPDLGTLWFASNLVDAAWSSVDSGFSQLGHAHDGPAGFYRVTLEPPQMAGDPSPAHLQTDVGLAPMLAWSPGEGGVSYDVYLGTDSPGEFMGNQASTGFDPGPLSPNTTYYWRVDARNGQGVAEGEVWSFSTAVRPSGIAYLGAGAPAASTGPIAPALPDGLLPGDILLLFLQTAGPRAYVEDVNGGTWLALARGAASPQSVGTDENEVHLTAYYSRYNGTQGAPAVSDSGDHQLGVVLAFRGVVASGVPWDAVDGNARAEMTTSAFAPGSTTMVPDTLVVGAIATSLPDADGGNNFSGWTNNIPGMVNVTGRVDVSTSAGNGGALGIATADFAPTGSYGRMNVTLAVPSYKAMLSAALRPQVSPGLVTEVWPADGDADVGATAELRWAASPNAATRDVYFGTANPPPFLRSQTAITFGPGALLPATTYYWRVDEKNATGTATGSVRSFTTSSSGVLPQLAGMTVENAVTELANAGCSVGTVVRVFSDTVAPGVAISQHPAPGTALQPGMAVDLVRSRGPEAGTVVFPNGPDMLDGEKLPVHRNVSLVTSQAGTLLAFAGHRPNGAPDEDDMEIHLRRSTDGGETWGPVIVVAEDGMNRVATQVAAVLPSGRILLLWCWNAWIPSESDRTTREIHVTHSDDDGLTWSPHRNITAQVYRDNWRWYGLGPGHAFVKTRPPNAGRLIIPARHGVRGAPGQPHIIYSDDGGETFQLGGELDIGNESTVCEQSDGDILFNVRADVLYRWAGVSSDGGLSFPVQYEDLQLPGADKCQASLLEHSMNPATGKANILFSNPDDLYERVNGTVKLSEHDGDPGTWSKKFRYSDPAPAFSGYSDIAVMNEAGDVGILWEFGSHYSKPARWDGGVKFRAITFGQIAEPVGGD